MNQLEIHNVKNGNNVLNEKPINKWLVFFLVAIGIFMSTLDSSIVNIALSTIMTELSADLNTIEWVMMAYLLTVSSLLLCFGRLSDIMGRRWVYSRGLGVFTVGSALCGMATQAWWLIGARAFQGVGAAMIMSCTPALVADTFPIAERGKALGLVGAVVAAGLTMGPALGGVMLHYASWQTIFYINIPIGLATAAASATILKHTKADIGRPESFDWAGAALLVCCLSPMLLAISHVYEWGYSSDKTLWLVELSLVSIAGLIYIEPRRDHPIIEPSLLKIRLFVLPVMSAAIMFAALFVCIFLMPFFLKYPYGVPVSKVGSVMVIPFIFLFVFAPISGILSDRMGSRFLSTFGMGILTIAMMSLSQLTPASDLISIAWRMALVGIGTAIFISPNSSTSMSAVPREYMGVAAGTVATARNLGMVIGIAVAGSIFNSLFQRASGIAFKIYKPEFESAFMLAFKAAMIVGAIMAGIGMMVAFMRGKKNSS